MEGAAGGRTAAEGEGATIGEAKWSAIRALEREHPGIDADDVNFEIVDEGDEAEGRPARVRGEVDADATGGGGGTVELPDEPVERIRAFLGRVIVALDL